MINAELARTFKRIADLLEIDGADRFRINSYRRAAATLEDAPEDVALLAEQGRLTELAGIGKSTAERIQQFLRTGRIDVLDELHAKLPAGLPDLLNIAGVGPKKVAVMHQKLGVASLDDLKKVIDDGRLAELAGFGETSVKKIAEGISFLQSSGGRTPLGLALPLAEGLAQRVAQLSGVKQVAIAGSLRRGLETIGDIDVVCEAKDGEAVVKQFVAFTDVKRVLASGPTKGSVAIDRGDGHDVQVDLRVVEKESFGAALQYFTGSKAHNVRLREMAVRRKWRLNEYGLFDGEKRLAGGTETSIYQKLGVPMVAPELREDRGELDVDSAPVLVDLADIRGDLHLHTVASDGHNTIAEMAQAASRLGYKYLAICDHSKSSTIANGLSIERMIEHVHAIRAMRKKMKDISILVGCECDILPDGSLDYPDEILSQCDWVVASIHSAMGTSAGGRKVTATQRTIAAMENRYVCAIGHPTGRIINRRAAMDLDMGEIVKAAGRTHTILEINASWHRLDLKDMHVRQAREAGVVFVIDTDAHSTGELEQMRFGVITARRGGATPLDVVNTFPLAELKRRIDRKRG